MLLNDDYGAKCRSRRKSGFREEDDDGREEEKALLLPTIPNVQSLRSGAYDEIVKRAFSAKTPQVFSS